jgi:hypothetical protein
METTPLWEAGLVEHTDAKGQRYANAAGVNHFSGMSDGSQGKVVGNHEVCRTA